MSVPIIHPSFEDLIAKMDFFGTLETSTLSEAKAKALIKSAYIYCQKAHAGQTRHSGDDYYTHPVAVAELLVNFKLDVFSVCAALLHDTVEDNQYTDFNTLRADFGEEISNLVKGVTRLDKLTLSEEKTNTQNIHAENLQQFVMATAEDIRVLLIKLCDRLHNMRTLHFHPKEASRIRIARETLDIYAPMARKAGIEKLSAELEDLAFPVAYSDVYSVITKNLTEWHLSHNHTMSTLYLALRHLLDKSQINASIYGREKRPFSIWQKLQKQKQQFNDIADIFAFRILVTSVDECYDVFRIFHKTYQCVQERFRDFISLPKTNGYQSLHTTILGPDNQRIEIQIRTYDMHDMAEHGLASHRGYKLQQNDKEIKQANPFSSWLEVAKNSHNAEEFIENVKLEMYTDKVFAFTPKRRVIALPADATPLDFSYGVHTKIGETCVGCRVNGRLQSLDYKLRSGDVVEIIRGGTAQAPQGWERMAITGKARSKLKRLDAKKELRNQYEAGYKMVDHAFAREGHRFSNTLLYDAIKRLNYPTIESLYIALGNNEVSIKRVMRAVFPNAYASVPEALDDARQLLDDQAMDLYIKGDKLPANANMHFSSCCWPIPPERIVGIYTHRTHEASKDPKVAVHAIDCDKLAKLAENPELWVDLAWRSLVQKTNSIAHITTTVEHIPGALAETAKTISNANGNISSIRAMKRSSALFDLAVEVEVTNAKHAIQILAALRASPYVSEANRTRSQQIIT